MMTNDEAVTYIIRHCNPDYPKGKTEWETAINMAIDALRNLPTQMSGTSDAVSRQAAIDEIRRCRFVVDAIEKINSLPSAQPKINNQINLCDSCRHTYPDCPAGKDDVLFGNGEGHDNICACGKYEVQCRQEIELDCDTCKHSEKQWDKPPCD